VLGGSLIGINLYFTQSFGAWLALAIALTIIFWMKYKESTKKKYFFAIFIVTIILISLASLSKLKNIKNLGERSSLASREIIWRSAGRMIEDNPFFGIGPGNFQNKYLEYQKYFPPYLEWSVPQPHNIYLTFWLESGLTGLVGFVWILILFFRDNIKTVRRTSNRDMGILFLAIVIYILVHGLVDTTYWRNDLALVFWMIIAGNSYLPEKYKDLRIQVD
jgi:O-antigen ligase